MTIDRRMTTNIITASLDMSLQDASELMKSNKVNCLPVLDGDWKLVGVVSDKDILRALPSPVSTLSVYEMNALVSNLTIRKIIRRNPITIQKNATIEEAAKLIIEKGVSWLPVMDGDKIVGIISKTDMIKMLMETFGSTSRGYTINFVVADTRGVLSKITSDITAHGLDLITCSVFSGESDNTKILRIKVAGEDAQALKEIVKPYATQILDADEN